jgi:MFS superfamily sulfate permease-like transporter
VFLGVAISTFFFVASFFRSGVVRFMATGSSIHSTIERTPDSAFWLDENGNLVQLLVLQNCLFFGNASSILTYVGTMFEEADDGINQSVLPPLPKIVVLELTLGTGMDTSAVDIFNEIMNVYNTNKCKLFLCGVPLSLRQSMQLWGFGSDKSASSGEWKLRFFHDLETAIGKRQNI